MAYQTKVLDFKEGDDLDRKVTFDCFMQVEMADRDISLKHAVVGSNQALLIYEDNTNGTTSNT